MRELEPPSVVVHDDEGHGRQIRFFGGDAEVLPFSEQRAAAEDDKDGSGSGVVEALPKYLQEIGRIPLLTAVEEVELAKAIEAGELARATLQGDGIAIPEPQNELQKNAEAFEAAKANPKLLYDADTHKNGQVENYDAKTQVQLDAVEKGDAARKRLTESNLRLVVSVARRYANRGMAFGDLIQEGNMGLSRAVEKFDYRRGFKFSTYATWWIRQAMSRALADQARTIRLPVHVGEFLTHMGKAEQELRAELGREPTVAEIAEKLETTEKRIRDMRSSTLVPVSLEGSVGDEDDAQLSDFIQDESLPDMDDEAVKAILKGEIEDVLATLTPRERRVMELRFGLDDGRNRTLKEIGAELGVTRERIRQIEAKALRKLHHPSRSQRLREIME